MFKIPKISGITIQYRIHTYSDIRNEIGHNEWYIAPAEVVSTYVNYGVDWFWVDLRTTEMLAGEFVRCQRPTVYDKDKKNKWYAFLPNVLRPFFKKFDFYVDNRNGEPQLPVKLFTPNAFQDVKEFNKYSKLFQLV